MDKETQSKRSLLVFSDDWGRHPSSCQHLVARLLDTTQVSWINTIGTRRPTLSPYTVRRSIEKLKGWLVDAPAAPDTSAATNPTVHSPIMWPSFRSSFGRGLNRRLLARQVSKLNGPDEDSVAVTTLPIVADLIHHIPMGRWVYYCVDDLSEWPGLDRDSLASMEESLVAKADRVVAASELLVERMAQLGRQADLLTHGIDLEFWSREDPPEIPELMALPEPRVVFWGVLDRRLDTACIRALSAKMRSGSILFVGPLNDPDPAVEKFSNVHLVGAVAFEKLPQVAQAAAALIMPYADSPVTRVLQPLKFKEYLATGKPTISTRLPAIREWEDCCDVATDPDSFADLVLQRLASGLPPSQLQARRRLAQETWSHKVRSFETILFD